LAARDDDELLCRAVCTLPRRLPNPDALSDSAFRDAIADGVDRPSAVLVGDELRKRKLGTGPSPAARLPVGGIHARDMDLDPHLTMPRFAHRSLDEAKDLRPTRMGIHNRFHLLRRSPSRDATDPSIAARGAPLDEFHERVSPDVS
jgi:hypothetical protein